MRPRERLKRTAAARRERRRLADLGQAAEHSFVPHLTQIAAAAIRPRAGEPIGDTSGTDSPRGKLKPGGKPV
jgi:hypothetical protein